MEPTDKARFWEAVTGAGPELRRHLPMAGCLRWERPASSTAWMRRRAAGTGRATWPKRRAHSRPCGATPVLLVVDDKVIVFAGGPGERNLLAYEIGSGKLAWTAAASHDSYASPQLVELGGRRQCLLLGDQGMNAVDPTTGEARVRYGWVMDGAA